MSESTMSHLPAPRRPAGEGPAAAGEPAGEPPMAGGLIDLEQRRARRDTTTGGAAEVAYEVELDEPAPPGAVPIAVDIPAASGAVLGVGQGQRMPVIPSALHPANLADTVRRAVGRWGPVHSVKWKAPKVAHTVDRRSVVNPVQARSLLNAVRAQKRSGGMLTAFFAVMYFTALRPEEAVNLRARNLILPAAGWGQLHIERAAPDAGKDWTDTGRQRDERQLKHRATGEMRPVPCPPELVTILREHLDRHGTDDAGRLFRGERGGELATITYTRVWDRARQATFTPEVYASPLAARPYDLRHAAVSTWLNAGVAPAQVAEWAGHSVDVLLKVYAKCIDGQDTVARQRVENALRGTGSP